MNLNTVDQANGSALSLAVTMLETLTRCPVVKWSPGQKEHALQLVREARALMHTDIVTLATRTAKRNRIDAVAAEVEANPPTPPEPPSCGSCANDLPGDGCAAAHCDARMSGWAPATSMRERGTVAGSQR